jgi:hypothetical protein
MRLMFQMTDITIFGMVEIAHLEHRNPCADIMADAVNE